MKQRFLITLAIAGILVGCAHTGSPRFPAAVQTEHQKSEKKPACGLQGSVQDRIISCSTRGSAENMFVLVTRKNDQSEVFLDKKTGLLWGDRLRGTMDFEMAKSACESRNLAGKPARLPTVAEFEEANTRGIRESLPNISHWFWLSAKHQNPEYAWVFVGKDGYVYDYYRHQDYVSVRCVAK